ncbi:MAG: flippase-like domain-containing protein [Desulfatibacillum sp.]|nr:flippase-like domain-containing protein [Desulfatibacillum sp.]
MSQSANHPLNKWIPIGAAVIVSACIYWALLKYSGTDFSGLWQVWQDASLFFLLGVLCFSVFVHVVLGADKLWRVLGASGFALPWPLVLKIRLGSGPLRVAMPVDMGEVLNIAFLRQTSKIPVADASGACLFDRGLNFLGSTFWLIAGLLLLPVRGEGLAPNILGIVGAGVLYGVFVFATPAHTALIRMGYGIHTKVGDFIKGVLSPFSRCAPGRKILFLGYGIVFQARPLIVCYLLFMALGIHPPMDTFITFASLAVFAGHIPTAAGIGPREAAVVLLFQGMAPAGALLAVGAAMSLFVHVLPMMAGVPWLPWFLRGISGVESRQSQ